MNDQDKDFLIRTLETKSIDALSVRDFFRSMGLAANLPQEWYASYMSQIRDDAFYSAQNVVRWAEGMNVNRKDPNFTTLGSLLYPLLKTVGLETARHMVVIIVSDRLIRDDEKLIQLMKEYGVPFPTKGTSGEIAGLDVALGPQAQEVKVGPDIDWRGPDEVTLQSFNWFQPDFMDGGFLMRATDRALSVCQVRIPQKQNGTGFLITPTLLLTNYHVLENPDAPGDKKEENAANAILRFNYTTTADGGESEGIDFKLDGGNPIVASSPVPELDFILLRVERKIKNAEGIKALTYKPDSAPDKSLNIIQHPNSGPLMFAFSSNGVTGLYDDGRIQYSSKAAGGSSGAPCFNDKWNLVAIHHAERSTWSGVKREGIQFSHIYPRIKDHLV
jgi:V8-like Glu-specific endopeptidase